MIEGSSQLFPSLLCSLHYMSKTTVKKAIADFDAAQLRELLIDIYGKSKEAKELLDFFADPDIPAKIEEYKKPLSKEINRYVRRAHRPRIPKIRAILKKFSVIEPGDEAVAELMVYAIIELCAVASDDWFKDSTNEAINKLFLETLAYLQPRMLLDEYLPRINKALGGMKDFRYYKNPLRETLLDTLHRFQLDLP